MLFIIFYLRKRLNFMLHTIETINSAVNNFIWGVPAMICIIGVGLYLSIRTHFQAYDAVYVVAFGGKHDDRDVALLTDGFQSI